jgi:transketolase C-terminal domain/subunit
LAASSAFSVLHDIRVVSVLPDEVVFISTDQISILAVIYAAYSVIETELLAFSPERNR